MEGHGHFELYLLHILITGPFLIYVGLVKPENTRWIYWILLALGIAVLLKFIYMIFTTTLSQRHVWFMIHAIIITPLLIWVGIQKENSPAILFSLLLAIGIAATGYHSVRLFQTLLSKNH